MACRDRVALRYIDHITTRKHHRNTTHIAISVSATAHTQYYIYSDTRRCPANGTVTLFGINRFFCAWPLYICANVMPWWRHWPSDDSFWCDLGHCEMCDLANRKINSGAASRVNEELENEYSDRSIYLPIYN